MRGKLGGGHLFYLILGKIIATPKPPSPTQSIFSMKIHSFLVCTAILTLPLLTAFTKFDIKSGDPIFINSETGAAARSAQEMVAAGYKRYGIEKGTFVFQYAGAMSGTDYIYFDNWGWREAKYSKASTKIGTFSDETNAVQYLDGENRYVYDPSTKKARYFDGRQAIVVADQYGSKDMVAFGDVLLRNMGGKPDGKVKVGEIDCDVWYIEKNNVRLYMWQGITMGEASYVNGTMVGRNCTSVELKKNPPLNKLVLPKDAVVEGRK